MYLTFIQKAGKAINLLTRILTIIIIITVELIGCLVTCSNMKVRERGLYIQKK